MKKVLLGLLLFLNIIFLTGCMEEMTPKQAVRDYLEMYVTLDDKVIDQIDEFLKNEELTEEQKEIYKNILKKQYSSLTYSLENERLENDDVAYVTAKIGVMDLYKAQKDSLAYYEEHKDEFEDEAGNYDKNKYLDYKLSQMKNMSETVEHEVTFKVVKNDNGWDVSQLSDETLEKIHGIYDYEE